MTTTTTYPRRTTVTLPSGIRVERYQIASTHTWVYSAWELDPNRDHAMITHYDDQRYGTITSRPLPVELDALPSYSKERYDAVHAWYDEQCAEAHAAIYEAFPELTASVVTIYGGDIDVTLEV